jgi:ELWxxDGT repeat protein
VLVKDINPGTGGSAPSSLTNVGGTLFFTAYGASATGAELWKSDGTASGTVLVKDINPGAGDSSSYYLTNVNGTLFFQANNGTDGTELWKSDGTAAGTVMVKDINPGNGSSDPHYLTISGVPLLMANDGATGTEPGRATDNRRDGARQGHQPRRRWRAGKPNPLRAAAGSRFLSADDGTSGRKLDERRTSAGTVRVHDIVPGAPPPLLTA